MNNYIKLTTLLAILIPAVSFADFSWGVVAGAPQILGPDDPSSLTPGNFTTPVTPTGEALPFTSGTGFLVQLIQVQNAPNNGSIDLFSANGVAGDDVVVDASFIGASLFTVGDRPGRFQPQSNGETDTAAQFYVRVWGAATDVSFGIGDNGGFPDPDRPSFYDDGGGNSHMWFADSAIFNNPDSTAIGPPQQVHVGSTADGDAGTIDALITSWNLVAVPEPGTLALFGLGGFALFQMQRRKKRNAKS